MIIKIPSDRLYHLLAIHERKSAVEEHTKIRKRLCDYMTSLQAKVLTPICEGCYSYKVHLLELPIEPPHICENTWKNDLAWEVGLTEKEIRNISKKYDKVTTFLFAAINVLLQYNMAVMIFM